MRSLKLISTFVLMACAGLVLSCIYTIVGAKWCGPYKRFAEGLAAWVPARSSAVP